VNDFRVVLAPPESVEDCVPEPFLPLVRVPPWVAYPTLGRRYLADVNDEPDLDVEYDLGLGRWVEVVRSLLRALFLRSPGRPVQISVPVQARAGQAAPGAGGGADRALPVGEPGNLDPDLLDGLTTYGGAATMWTSLPGAASVVTTSMLAESAPWWVSQGYKEPFLVAHVPALGELINAQARVWVEQAGDPFVPHRIRMHRRRA
jgi:hypothetical protein